MPAPTHLARLALVLERLLGLLVRLLHVLGRVHHVLLHIIQQPTLRGQELGGGRHTLSRDPHGTAPRHSPHGARYSPFPGAHSGSSHCMGGGRDRKGLREGPGPPRCGTHPCRPPVPSPRSPRAWVLGGPMGIYALVTTQPRVASCLGGPARVPVVPCVVPCRCPRGCVPPHVPTEPCVPVPVLHAQVPAHPRAHVTACPHAACAQVPVCPHAQVLVYPCAALAHVPACPHAARV